MCAAELSLSERDQQAIWHPYSALIGGVPIAIERAQDEILYAHDKREYIDLISSWWVNIHGHGNPLIAERIKRQIEALDHVIFAGFTHAPAVELAEALLKHLPRDQKRVFLSDNGSTAVEVALKMAIQFWSNSGEERQTIAVISGSYHGDTVGAMSVSERGVFTRAFGKLLFDVVVLPRPTGDGSEFLEHVKRAGRNQQVAAFLYEPLVQGAGGMFCYQPQILEKALQLFKSESVICIADEVMTGFGRTGRWFASDYMETKPDIFCLSKGITGGVLPLGATVCNARVESAFATDDRSKIFFHGHSYTANPIACAAACASIELLEEQKSWHNIARIEESHRSAVEKLARIKKAENVRSRGTILALDFNSEQSGYLSPISVTLYNYFLERGLLIRPLGNVIYLMPPYCIRAENLERAYRTIEQALQEID